MVISEKQIFKLMSYLRDFIEDSRPRNCIEEPIELLLEIENQQSDELKEIK